MAILVQLFYCIKTHVSIGCACVFVCFVLPLEFISILCSLKANLPPICNFGPVKSCCSGHIEAQMYAVSEHNINNILKTKLVIKGKQMEQDSTFLKSK